MGFLAILLLGVGLSLDALAISLSLGFLHCGIKASRWVRFPIIVGVFHFFMILIGWFVGDSAHGYIQRYDHYIAFILLALVGIKMMKESFDKDLDKEDSCDVFSMRNTLMVSLAISIDALITGFSLGMVPPQLGLETVCGNIILTAAIIGAISLILSFTGLYIGRKSKVKLGNKAEFIGGLILLLLGVKILIEHLLAQ